MGTTPRIALDDRAQNMGGIIDPVPMYDPDLVTLSRTPIMKAYMSPILSAEDKDRLRIFVAENIDCGVCKHMRDNSADIGTLPDGANPSTPIESLIVKFLSDPHTVEARDWDAAVSELGEAGAASAMMNIAFSNFHAKLIVLCGLEPESADALENTSFDSSKYSIEDGAIGMIADKA